MKEIPTWTIGSLALQIDNFSLETTSYKQKEEVFSLLIGLLTFDSWEDMTKSWRDEGSSQPREKGEWNICLVATETSKEVDKREDEWSV